MANNQRYNFDGKYPQVPHALHTRTNGDFHRQLRHYSTYKPTQGTGEGTKGTPTEQNQEQSIDHRRDNSSDLYYEQYREIFSQGLETADGEDGDAPSLTEHLRQRQYKAYRDQLAGTSTSDFLTDSTEDAHVKLTHTDAEVKLTHTDAEGKARMVDVGGKPETSRVAVAEGSISLGQPAFSMVEENKMKKGDVLSVAQIAGIMAAKKTSTLIPLCHDLQLTKVDVHFRFDRKSCRIVARAEARTRGQTGVEMEALTAVSVALLTVYDMCKAVTHDMTISDIRLMSKEGGQRGTFTRAS